MFQKKKKFKEESTPEKRLHDRWEQQVFFMTKKFPHAGAGISAIKKKHTPSQQASFAPSEDALLELASLYTKFLESGA